MRNALSIPLGVLVAIIVWNSEAAAQADAQSVQTYRFVHEGIYLAPFVEIDKKHIPIEFSEESNPRAVQLLNALKREVQIPSAGGDRAPGYEGANPGGIYLVGRLHDDVARQRATGEPLREFTLERWYIASPILENLPDPMHQYKVIKTLRRGTLRKSDFKGGMISDEELTSLQRKP